MRERMQATTLHARSQEALTPGADPGSHGGIELQPGVGALSPELRLRAENARLRAELARTEHQRSLAEDRLTWLQDIGDAMARRARPEDAMRTVLERAARMVRGEQGALYLVQDDGESIAARVVLGRPGVPGGEIRLRLGQGLAGYCARTQRPVNVKDAWRDPRFDATIDRATGIRTVAVLCVPLKDRRGRLLGVIQVINRDDGSYFTMDDEQLLSSAAVSIGILLENFRYYLREIDRNIELSETRKQLEERVRELDALYELQRSIHDADNQHEELSAVARTALSLLPSSVCLITLISEGELISQGWRASSEDVPRLIPLTLAPRAVGASRQVLSGCSALRETGDELSDRALFDELQLKHGSHLAVPIRAEDRCVGALELLNRRAPARDGAESRFTEEDQRLLSLIAGQIGRSLLASQTRRQRMRDERIATIGSMISGILHDLKTPLTIASGYVQLMERADDRERRKELGGAVQRQFEDIRQMAVELVAYARGETLVYERVVHLVPFAEELKQWLAYEFEDTGITADVRLDCRGDLRLDDGKLKRILFNLARNAREAMADGGNFQVVLDREGDTLRIRCRDTGGGIPEPIQHTLFNAFVSVGKEKRSGLGLAIVRKLTDELGATIDFTSSPGEGTEFRILVPWVDAE